jgi:serine/threonine-protein kinase RsbW
MTAETVRLTMPAKAEYLILARLALAGIAREVPMSETALADLKLAVTEACGNAIRHAYAADRGVVRVVYAVEPDAIEIHVEDDGGGLPSESMMELLDFDELAESGMGLAIIRAVVDEFEVQDRGEGAGTLVRMRKQL